MSLVREIYMLIYRRDKSAGKRGMIAFQTSLPVMFVAAQVKREGFSVSSKIKET